MVGLLGRIYEEKLVEMEMRTLEERRKRLDLVQTLKIIRGIDKVESTIMFTSVARPKHSVQNLMVSRSRTDLRKAFFLQQNFHTL